MMLKFLITTILLIDMHSISAHAEGQNSPADEKREIAFDSREPLFVSLGPECYFAWYLHELGYRKAAFPFDWLLTLDHKGLIELIDDDFKYFFDDAYYSIHTNGHLIHNYYHIEFRHEHDNDFKGKYGRRINRFRQLNDYQGKVFFMRKAYPDAEHPLLYWPNKEMLNISSKWAFELNRALKKRFYNLDYNLVIVNYSGREYKFQIIDNVIIFNFPFESSLDQLSIIVSTLFNLVKNPLAYSN